MSFRTPAYRLHKPSGQAVVTINGTDFYLGPHDSDQSKAEYDRLIGEWLAAGRRLPVAKTELTVNEVLLAYMRFAEDYYRESKQEYPNIARSLRPVKERYGHTSAGNFGPLALKAIRQTMVEANLCRNEINKRVRHIIRAFKWAVENELAPPAVFQALKAVPGLRRGRSEARESAPVKPVPEAYIDAIRGKVLPPVWAMIELQRLTGMRPGEVTAMRGCDLNTSGKVWTCEPAQHKTAHHGHCRTIFIGPKAQAVLRPWLKTELQAYLFSPREAVEAQWAARRKPMSKARTFAELNRRSRRKPKMKRLPAERYTVESYGRAIARGIKRVNCERKKVDAEAADVPHWHPHQLRHNAATWIRREFGLDVARVILGHRTPVVTEIYAEADHGKAMDVMARVG